MNEGRGVEEKVHTTVTVTRIASMFVYRSLAKYRDVKRIQVSNQHAIDVVSRI